MNKQSSSKKSESAQTLLVEAKKVNDFLKSEDIPWAIGSVSRARGGMGALLPSDIIKIFAATELACANFWSALVSILLREQESDKDEKAILEAVGLLAERASSQKNVTGSGVAKSIRYYPLVVSLYIICIAGVAQKRDKLLKEVFKISLPPQSSGARPLPITESLFSIRNASELFQWLNNEYPKKGLSDPIATRIKLIVDRWLTPADWNPEKAFYEGEFILCLSPMEGTSEETGKPIRWQPASGLYLFDDAAVSIIGTLLKEEKDWIKKIFQRPLKDLLADFDAGAKNVVADYPAAGFMNSGSKAIF